MDHTGVIRHVFDANDAEALAKAEERFTDSEGHLLAHSTTWRLKMAMLNWNDYRNQILARIGEIGNLSPDTVKGYAALSGAGAKTGHLDSKTHELIAVAVAITLRCDGCIAVHSAAAKKLGATKEEIAEALGVGISVNAGAALVYSTRTVDAYDAAT